MAKAKQGEKEKLHKKLEALQRLQQTNAILQEGGVRAQALQTSADDQWPSEDAHLLDLLEKSKIKAPQIKERRLEEEEHIALKKSKNAHAQKNKAAKHAKNKVAKKRKA
ncbi:MAG: hypothetical protein ACP5T4_00540 [Candidatus Micrarchaeia archaeon]